MGLKDVISDVVTGDGKVEITRRDNGGEFKGRFADICGKSMIRLEFSPHLDALGTML